MTLAIISVGGVMLAAMAARKPGSRSWTYVMLVMAYILGLNAISHIGLSIYFRQYMGGVITALLMFPFCLLVLHRAWRERWRSRTNS